ncbi:serine/threonine protein kinase [Nakamurella sp. YIM 132087]|uniref:non-specific serine/threonine protein kinase n=1 Tax=Nakamurella alba TaxID=2665158 RepID=A0A7K1FHX9_9ACTN|nr:serine/threonine protein kinase [Nakamurella alba]
MQDLADRWSEQDTRRRPDRRPVRSAPRIVLEGKSGRHTVDVDEPDPTGSDSADVGPDPIAARGDDAGDAEIPYSSYDVATHGPDPAPEWLIRSLSARDTRLGVIKTGKEADVSLLDRSLPGGPGCLLAVKTYRSSEHRQFHRDAEYQEGRRTRRSRETRAMAARTRFGRDLLAGKWAGAEFQALTALWRSGARVPYPVQIIGSELMMEFIGGPDGAAAPRLADHDGDTQDFTELWHDLVASLEVLAEDGLTHGDLSQYNVLVHEDRCVLIDLPQTVDLVANPQGRTFLERDCAVIAQFFARRGVQAADGELLALHLAGLAH